MVILRNFRLALTTTDTAEEPRWQLSTAQRAELPFHLLPIGAARLAAAPGHCPKVRRIMDKTPDAQLAML